MPAAFSTVLYRKEAMRVSLICESLEVIEGQGIGSFRTMAGITGHKVGKHSAYAS